MAATASTPQPEVQEEMPRLELNKIIGFTGSLPSTLLTHPSKQILYPLGSTVVIQAPDGSQKFLHGHTNTVTCIAVSKSGKWIASGQCTHMGFMADIILWDFETLKPIKKFTLHKVKVQSLAFSPSETYLASLGGQDDNSIIIWDLTTGAPICGAPASKDSSGVTLCLSYSNKSDTTFVTGGHATLRTWSVNIQQRKLTPTDFQMGQIKRIVNCLSVDQNDEMVFCGTTTGDLMMCHLGTALFKGSGPAKSLFSMGILSTAITPAGDAVIVGCGDGTVASLKLPKLNVGVQSKLAGPVTSLTFTSPTTLLASTSHSNMYSLPLETLAPTLLTTGHYTPCNDIAFPPDSSELFATASDADIRVWDSNGKELLRVHIPGLECKCVVFKKDGSSLISGWNDGKIRAFGPQSGRLQYEINDAHKKGVTALAVTDIVNEDGEFRIVSGGEDGQVRVWRVTRQVQIMEEAMKEHKGTITSIHIRNNNLEAVSSSSDGSCIIWDLSRFVRNQVLFAPSFFKVVKYFPDESQLLTSGTDRKVAYWEAFDGSLIREIEASQSDAINGLDITRDGKYFVIGGSDKLVKVYRYEEGDVAQIGVGHSTDILRVRISPDQTKIVTVSVDGAIYIWKFPFKVGEAPASLAQIAE